MTTPETAFQPIYVAPAPEPPPVRGRRLAWVLGILCALFLVAGGVGGAIFYNNLTGWNRTIADQENQIASLTEKDKSQHDTLDDRNRSLSAANRKLSDATAEDRIATACHDSMQKFFDQIKAGDLAGATSTLTGIFVACRAL